MKNFSFIQGLTESMGKMFDSSRKTVMQGLGPFVSALGNTTHAMFDVAFDKVTHVDIQHYKTELRTTASYALDVFLYYLRIVGSGLIHYLLSFFLGIKFYGRHFFSALAQGLKDANLEQVLKYAVVMKTMMKNVLRDVTQSRAGAHVTKVLHSCISTLSSHDFQRWAMSIILTLLFGAWLWGLSTGVILGKIFRRPLKNMGIEYRSMSFSPLRLSITVTDLKAYPTTCGILRIIMLCILPSSDVKTPPILSSDDDNNKQHEKHQSTMPSSMPNPSYISIEYLCIRPSFRLWWVRPLTLFWSLKAASASTSKNKKAGGGSSSSNEGSHNKRNNFRQSSRRHRWVDWVVKHVAICGPAPMLMVECRRIRVEVDKVYLGPMVPDDLYGGDFSNLPGSVRAAMLASEEESATTDNQLSTSNSNGKAPLEPSVKPSLPTFFAEKLPMLDSFRANGATFNLERWLEQTQKARERNEKNVEKQRRKSRSRSNSSSMGKTTETYANRREHNDVSTYDEDREVHSSTYKIDNADDNAASNMFEVTSEDSHGSKSTPNALLQTTFRILLNAFQFQAHEFEYIVRGAGASSLKQIQRHLSPDHACLALARMSRRERAVTAVGVRDFSLSFHGYNSDLIIALEDMYVRVGSPVPPRQSSRDSGRSRSSASRKGRRPLYGGPNFENYRRRRRFRKAGYPDAPQIRDEEWYRPTWTDVVKECDCVIHVGGVLDVAVWLFGYDYFWYRKSLTLSLSIINQTLNLDPEPLHTVLVHFDDWIDGNCYMNEWRTWFIKQTKTIALTPSELSLYRACYKEARLNNGNKKKPKASAKNENAADGSLEQHGHNPNESRHDGTTLAPDSHIVGHDITSDDLSQFAANDTQDPEDILNKLEQRMEFDQIMEQRKIVMGTAWTIPWHSSELHFFINASGRNISSSTPSSETSAVASLSASSAINDRPQRSESSRHLFESSPAIMPYDSVSELVGEQNIPVSRNRRNHFEHARKMQMEAQQQFLFRSVVALVESKASLMACRLSVVIMLPTWKLLLSDENSRISKDAKNYRAPSQAHSSQSHAQKSESLPLLISMNGCQTVYASKSRVLPYLGARKGLREKQNGEDTLTSREKAFMQLHLSTESLRWGAAPSFSGARTDVPRFLSNGATCGLLYEQPARRNNFTFALDLMWTPVENGNGKATSFPPESCTDIKLQTGDVLFVVVPTLVAEVVRVVPKVLALPYRYPGTEPPMAELKRSKQDCAENPELVQIDSRDTMDSDLTDGDIEITSTTDDDENAGGDLVAAETSPATAIEKPQYAASILGGANMKIAARVYNVSQVFLMHGADLDSGSLELYLRELNFSLVSDKDHEQIKLNLGQRSDKALRLTSCRIYSRKGSGQLTKGVYVHNLPQKEAFVLDRFVFSYLREAVPLGIHHYKSEHVGDMQRSVSDDTTTAAGQESLAPVSSNSVEGQTGNNGSSSPHRSTYNVSGKVSISVGTFVVNITPTFTAVANGIVNSLTEHLGTGNTNKVSIDESENDQAENESLAKFAALRDNRDLFRDIWRKYDTDGSGSLTRDELKMLIIDIYAHLQDKDGIKSTKATQPTDRELERDLHVLIKIIDRAQDQMIHAQEFEAFLFPELYQTISSRGVLESNMDQYLMTPDEQFMGVIHYDDLQEFSSTIESYRITGTKEKDNFPPASTWRRGKGIKLFWELYERETGCSETSLNGQNVLDVQAKLVRSLCNYNFAKYCWKALVRPKLQEQSLKVVRKRRQGRGRRRQRIEAAYHTVTDWVLDGKSDTRLGIAAGSGIRKSMHMWVLDQSKRDKSKNPLEEAARSVLCRFFAEAQIEAQEIFISIGNAISSAKPLIVLKISKFSTYLSSYSSPTADAGGVALRRAQLTAYQQNSGVYNENDGGVSGAADSKSNAKSAGGSANTDHHSTILFHSEVSVEATYLNTKHDTMETLLEPVVAFSDATYSTNEVSLLAAAKKMFHLTDEKTDEDVSQAKDALIFDTSITIRCFNVGINTSPSLFSTFVVVDDVILHCTPKRYQSFARQRLEENLRETWMHFAGSESNVLDSDGLENLLAFLIENRGMEYKRNMGKITTTLMEKIDVDKDGTVSYSELYDAILVKSVCRSSMFDSTSRIRLKNMTGEDLKYSSRVDFNRDGTGALRILAHERIVPLYLDASFYSSIRSNRRQDGDSLVLFLPRFEILDGVPISAFQTSILSLKSITSSQGTERSSQRKKQKTLKVASCLEPTLTLVPKSDILDTITLEVRSSVVVEARTAIDIQVVQLSSRRFRAQRHLSKKKFMNVLDSLGDDAKIVYEKNGIARLQRVPLPVFVILSSSMHMLYVRDSDPREEQPWRPGILLHRDFLFNDSRRGEITRYHARAGVNIERDRLSLWEKGRSDSGKAATATSWDTTIQVLPFFVFTNALPFPIKFICWQNSGKTGSTFATSKVATDATTRDNTRQDYVDDGEDFDTISSDETATSAGGGKRKNKQIKRHSKDSASSRAFVEKGRVAEGDEISFNGINMKEPMFICVAQAMNNGSKYGRTHKSRNFGLNQEDAIYWTPPIRIDVDRLQAWGNINGKVALPTVSMELGDEADLALNTIVERNGTVSCTIFSPYWVINKSGMKMEYRFTGREETMHDSGVGGLPILAQCKEEKNSLDKLRVAKREISAIPLESVTSTVMGVWWDEEKNGELVLNRPMLRKGGKILVDWSDSVGLDQAGTIGEINCGGILVGVGIETLTGIFHRSNLVTFLPKYIVQNRTKYPISLAALHGNSFDIATHFASEKDLAFNAREQYCTLEPGQSTIIYKFDDVASFGSSKPTRFICFKTHQGIFKTREKWHLMVADFTDPQYFSERDLESDKIIDLLGAESMQVKASTVIKLFQCERPPLRIENRSNEFVIKFAQEENPNAVWMELLPMTWCAYSWDDPLGKKVLKVQALDSKESKARIEAVKVAGTSAPSAGGPVSALGSDDESESEAPQGKAETDATKQHGNKPRSRLYDPFKVGEKTALPVVSGRRVSKRDCLQSDLRILKGARVLAFSDSSWRAEQIELGHLRTGGNWKNVSLDFRLEGIVLSLADYFPHEVLSITLRDMVMSKPKGQVDVRLVLRYLQIDAMQESARYPIILIPLHLGVDRRPSASKTIADSVEYPTQYWQAHDEKPFPVFEASVSYLPQPQMLWIPELSISICPMRMEIELEYMLKIVDLILNSVPEATVEQNFEEVASTLREINSRLDISNLIRGKAAPAYFEKIHVKPTLFELEFDIKPENAQADEGGEGQSIVALTSMGKTTRSTVSASVLSWVTNVSATFAHINPTFRFPEVIRTDTYKNAEDVIRDLVIFYVTKIIFQSYKVLFSMHVFGEPTQLVGQFQTGITEFVTLTRDEIVSGGEDGVGRGVESLVKNLVGGSCEAVGKIFSSFADIIDATFIKEDLLPQRALTASRAPDHLGEGIMQGSLFFTLSLTRGVLGVVGNPYKGVKSKSPTKFASGMAYGLAGLAAGPVVGALGFVAKLSDGIGATTRILEIKVIEARCRPSRVVNWGCSLGSIGFPYLKAFGIRIHFVTFEKKFGEANAEGSTIGPGKSARGSVRSGDSISKKNDPKGVDEQQLRKIPTRRLVCIRQPKSSFVGHTGSGTPTVLKEVIKEGATNVFLQSVVFEDTVIIRVSDLELSDEIELELWKSSKFFSYTRKRSPEATCKFTVQEAYTSMLRFKQAENDKEMINLSHGRTNPKNSGFSSARFNDGCNHQSITALGPRNKSYGYATSFRKNPLTHVVTPAFQEFALKSVPIIKRRSKRKEHQIVGDIHDELRTIMTITDEILESEAAEDDWSGNSQVSSSSSEALSDDRGLWEDDESEKERERRRKNRTRESEHNFGHAFVSFIPIPW